MAEFLDKDFLLQGQTAKTLFHEYADKMPIIDYHCHIDPAEIYKDKRFTDLSEAWLGGDHYIWRLMRANGVNEEYVTGNAPGWEKFRALAEVLPRAIGNPVYHWAHLELDRYFGCKKPLNPDTARQIWDLSRDMLERRDDLTVRGIIKRMKVEAIITTDDPADNLEWHKRLAVDDTFSTKVLPGWRPTLAMDIESSGYISYIEKLGEAAGVDITDFNGLKTALKNRMEYFKINGCLSCDHGFGRLVSAPVSGERLSSIFAGRIRGRVLTEDEADSFRYGLLCYCAEEYARLGWVMQLHLSALRNVNTVMYNKLGADSGFDCVGHRRGVGGLAAFLDELEIKGSLPKTLIFSIDPADNSYINTLAWCFAQDGVRGKVQQGSAWWFNDTFCGIDRQIRSFAETGVLGNFVGMLTDSRSFLSYTRHEYFRRILCRILGEWADSGLYPSDIEPLGRLTADICYNNAKDYFGLY